MDLKPDPETPGASVTPDAAAGVSAGPAGAGRGTPVHGRSLRTQIALILTLALLLPGVAAIAQAAWTLDTAQALQREALLSSAVLSAQEARTEIVLMHEALQVLSTAPAIRTGDLQACEARLQEWRRALPRFPVVARVDAKSAVICADPPLPPGLSLAAPEGSAPRTDRFFISALFRGRVSGKQVLAGALPLFDESGAFEGYLTASLPAERLARLMQRGNAVQGTESLLVDHLGQIIGQDPERTATDPTRLPTQAELQAAMPLEAPRLLEESQQLLALAPLYEQDLFLLIGAARDAATQPVELEVLLASSAMIPVLMWGIAIVVACWALDQLVLRHFLRVTRLAQSLGRGQLGTRLDSGPSAPQEIQELSQVLNDMAGNLALRQSSLQKALQEQKTLLREVHHRVKNNLQMMSSLLNLQSRETNSAVELRVLQRVQERVQALALVHQRLYDTEGLHRLRLDGLLTDVLRHIVSTHAEDGVQTPLDLDLAAVESNIDQALPLAFLVTETAIALLDRPHRQGDRMGLRLAPEGESGGLLLEISHSRDLDRGRSGVDLALRLITAFTKQLRGQARQEGGDRFLYRLSIPAAAG